MRRGNPLRSNPNPITRLRQIYAVARISRSMALEVPSKFSRYQVRSAKPLNGFVLSKITES